MTDDKKKNGDIPVNQTHNWSLVGFRIVYVFVVTGLLFMPGSQVTIDNRQLIMALFISLVMTMILALLVLTPEAKAHLKWGILIGDWLTIGAFVPIVGQNMELAILLVAGLMATSAVVIGLLWGLIDGIISAMVFAGVLIFISATGTSIPLLLLDIAVPLILMVILPLFVGMLSQQQEHYLIKFATSMKLTADKASAYANEIEERTQAITEMAQTLSSTLNYHRVLDAALKVGRLALKDLNSGSFSSIVLLYQPENRTLVTFTGRGLARTDEGRVIPGRTGLVGDALTLCEPMFGNSVRKDPELGQFATLSNVRSTVVIPLRAGYDNYGVIIFSSRSVDAFDERYRSFMEAIGIQTTIALQNAALYQEVAEEKERIVEVEEEARKKLARDLHDGPTQTVSAIAMRMSIIQKMMERSPQDVPKELEKIEDLARQTTTEIRHMLFTLRPLALESRGLSAALEQFAEKMDAVYDQSVDVVVSSRAEELMTQHQSGTIFYIIEEAVNNARKHAKAPVIRVRVSTYEDIILVEIQDDGVGFDVKAVTGDYEKRGSLGMVNLHDRADLIAGSITIDSAPGRGTNISVVVPLDPTGNNEKFTQEQGKRRRGFQLYAIR